MLFFKTCDKLFHAKLFKWLVTLLTAFKIEFSFFSLKLLALLSVRRLDKDKLYLLRQALDICILRSVLNSLSIRILNELSLFIESLTFNNFAQLLLQIYYGWDNHKRHQIFFFPLLAWRMCTLSCFCLKISLWGMINYSTLNNSLSFSAGIKHRC